MIVSEPRDRSSGFQEENDQQNEGVGRYEKAGIPFEVLREKPHYTNVPAAMFEARRNGDISPLMFDVLFWIRSHMDYKLAVCKRVSARTILKDMWPETSAKKLPGELQKVRRALHLLAMCGWISKPEEYETDRNYPVTVYNHVVVDTRASNFDSGGDRVHILLRPMQTIPYRDALKGLDRADDRAVIERCQSNVRAMSERCQSGVTPTLYSLVSSWKTEEQEEQTTTTTTDVVVVGSQEKQPEPTRPGGGADDGISVPMAAAQPPHPPVPPTPLRPDRIWKQTGLWDEWVGDLDGHSELEIRHAILYQLEIVKNPWYRENFTNLGVVKRCVLKGKLHEDTPNGWQPPKLKPPEPKPNPGCPVCRGTGHGPEKQINGSFVAQRCPACMPLPRTGKPASRSQTELEKLADPSCQDCHGRGFNEERIYGLPTVVACPCTEAQPALETKGA